MLDPIFARIFDGPAFMKLLDELLDEIQSLTVGDQWEIDTDMMLSIIQMERVDYYKVVYSMRHKGPVSLHIRDSYDQDNAEELVELLKAAGYSEAEKAFQQEGYFLERSSVPEWVEFFLSVSMSRMQNHEIDRDLLETALSATSHTNDGLDFYVHDVLPIDDLVDFAAKIFLRKREMNDHHLSRKILHDHIIDHMRRRILREEDLYAGLIEILMGKARKLGILSDRDIEKESHPTGLTAEEKEALRVLGFKSDKSPTLDELKKRYRNLLKKNHPDINPEGEDVTRKLTAAYTLLVSGGYRSN